MTERATIYMLLMKNKYKKWSMFAYKVEIVNFFLLSRSSQKKQHLVSFNISYISVFNFNCRVFGFWHINS